MNMQSEHSDKIDRVETLLWIIIAIVALQLLVTIYKIVTKRMNKKVLQKARSLSKVFKLSRTFNVTVIIIHETRSRNGTNKLLCHSSARIMWYHRKNYGLGVCPPVRGNIVKQ